MTRGGTKTKDQDQTRRCIALREDLPRRIRAVVDEVQPAQRHQVLRDLCVVARADGEITPGERHILVDIAKGLGLGPQHVCRIVDAPPELD